MTETSEKPFSPLADGFKAVTRADWVDMVEKGLKGRTISDISSELTYEGVALKPIYGRDDEDLSAAGNNYTQTMAKVRCELNSSSKQNGWQIRQAYFQSDPEAINLNIKKDISGGANSLLLKVTHEPDGIKAGAAHIRSITDLEKLLNGIDLESNSISFMPDNSAIVLASMFSALMQKRRINFSKIFGNFGGDPVGSLASSGRLEGNINEHLKSVSELAAWNIKNMPGMRAFNIDTTAYHAAGVTETEDLAIAMSTAVTYLRSMVSNGLNVKQAFEQVSFTISVGTDVFQVIAKLRAARFIWSRIAMACGVKKNMKPMQLDAITATRILSRRDIAVNMLRSTSACFAAGTGGATSVTLYPHTYLLGIENSKARRIVRNTQNILINESSLGRVTDPGGGSHYVEYLTREFAKSSWGIFQEIEAKGGVFSNLISGEIQKMAEKSWASRQMNLANRNEPLTGVSSFPDLSEVLELKDDIKQPNAQYQLDTSNINDVNPVSYRFDDLIKAAAQSALANNLLGGFSKTITSCNPLKSHRLAEAYEQLRDHSDRWLESKGSRPLALIVCLGLPSDYTEHAVFAKNYLAVAGIESIEAEVGLSTLSERLRPTKTDLIVICSSEKVYSEQLQNTLKVIKSHRESVIVLTASPVSNKNELKSSGVDLFIYANDNMLETLSQIARRIGMLAL